MSHQFRGDEEQALAYSRNPQYSLAHTTYHSYPNQLLAGHNNPNPVPSGTANQPYAFSFGHPTNHTLPPTGYHYSQHYAHSRCPASPRYFSAQGSFREVEIEGQVSCNENSMLSEPVSPPLEGFPDVREFDQLMEAYVDDLSIKKQDKALIHARRARNIRTVLLDPKDTAVESAQFRFWVKKMFKLEPSDARTPESKRLICHEGKPVAIREKLFKILTRAHQQCQHGGRDKTSAQVRRIYSWVPKELISRFVKMCPTCQIRRGGSRATPPESLGGSPKFDTVTPAQPLLLSPPDSRGESVAARQTMSGVSRPQHPATYGYSWDGTHGTHHHVHNPYHAAMPSVPPAVWGSLPRSITGAVDNSGMASSLAMSSNQFDYSTSAYDEPHGISGQHHPQHPHHHRY